MRRLLSILLLGLATVWAASYRGASAADIQPWNGDVQTFAALRSMYHEGQIGPRDELHVRVGVFRRRRATGSSPSRKRS